MTETLERPNVAAAAPNWRSIILIDAGLGAALVVIGAVLAVIWMPWLGAVVAAVGVVYTALVVRRGLSWHRWRKAVGLDQ